MSGISEDDFIRLQTQLVDLKTLNYQLEDKGKKHERELTGLQNKITTLTSDLNKANASIQKSKKAKEVQGMLTENQQLHLKLASQEQEFSLQNDTLLSELTRLSAINDDLEKRMKFADQQETDLNRDDSIEEDTDDIEKLKISIKTISTNLKNSQANYARVKTEKEDATLNYERENSQIKADYKLTNDKLSAENIKLKLENKNICDSVGSDINKMKELSIKMKNDKDMYHKQLEELQYEHAKKISLLEEQFNDSCNENAIFIAEITDLKEEIEKINSDKKSHATSYIAVKNEFEKLQLFKKKLEEDLQNSEETSEKRKQLMNELVSRYEKEKLIRAEEHKKHSDVIRDNDIKYKEQIDNLNSEISQFKLNEEKQHKMSEEIENLKKVKSNDNKYMKELLHQLICFKDDLITRQSKNEDKLKQINSDYEAKIEKLIFDNNEALQIKENDICKLNEILECTKNKVVDLEQNVEDLHIDSKLHEKKITATTKDLKKQLQSERKKNERMQELVQHSISKNSSGIEELLTRGLRAGSSCSAGAGGGEGGAAGNTSPTPYDVTLEVPNTYDPASNTSPTSPSAKPQLKKCDQINLLERENGELLEKYTTLQEEKWELDEKLLMLRKSHDTLSDDLASKMELIDHYVIQGGSQDKKPEVSANTTSGNSFLRIVEKVSHTVDAALSPEDKDLKKTVESLQRMIEETLTKNMYLQRNLLELSSEYEKLKKETVK